jgi:hypothetical protein
MRRPVFQVGFENVLLRGLAWLLAASVTALVAHGLIDFVDRLGAPASDAYGERAHTALGPVAVIALMLACALVARAVAIRLGRVGRVDPFVALGRSLRTTGTVLSSIAVGAGGLCLLVAMEVSEQFCAVGHFEGIDDALGGNVPIGIAIVLLVATLVVSLGLRFARAALSAGLSAAESFVAWISFARPALAVSASAHARPVQHRRHASEPAFLARTSGLRAPPPTI